MYGSDQVSAMHPLLQIPFFFFLGGGGGKKGKETCNLFRVCLYFEEDILNQNR